VADKRRQIADDIGCGGFHITRSTAKELVQAGRDEGKVDGSHTDLQGGELRLRQGKAPASDFQFAAHESGEHQVSGAHGKAAEAECDGRHRSEPGDLAGGSRKQEQA